MFGMLYETFPANRRLFKSRSFLSGLGTRVAKRKINDEKALEYFLHNSVEHQVRTIMDELKNVEEIRRALDLGDGTFSRTTHMQLAMLPKRLSAAGTRRHRPRHRNTPAST
ncbi:hypothetical protein CGGC5_v017113 [Colletotrichum fructicola Nara gc5]|uniref:Uncharacterized protein n=1 Tax=Colletotrichum fructicola (strain Nara gc5) TaxID=1213859 RepID=A0A7J6IF02_COLFN|nr:hypothetical protein CFRS1_v015289 [Colletotrichum fructicola]KAF4474436.1 hypothetical protein CGGC5_v017113 [Colletotrichum fructicola Nara gc5]KAF4880997.1 hypothetical protein CGCFRS4_v015998 [Colletotrichum fructicola]